MPAAIDLNWGQDLTLPHDWRNLITYSDWLLLTERGVVIGCLLINSCDSYHSMIVRFALPATRGFLSLLLFLSCLISSRQKKTSGTRVHQPYLKKTKTTPALFKKSTVRVCVTGIYPHKYRVISPYFTYLLHIFITCSKPSK